jgi:hypothetical protein
VKKNIILVIKSTRMSWAGNVACIENRKGTYRVSVVRPDVKRPLGRPWHRWNDNIKMDLQEMEW